MKDGRETMALAIDAVSTGMGVGMAVPAFLYRLAESEAGNDLERQVRRQI